MLTKNRLDASTFGQLASTSCNFPIVGNKGFSISLIFLKVGFASGIEFSSTVVLARC